ncbi:MAG TPA: hypothetical protein VI362_03855 [Ignavibacteriaceae bacterium]|nr:hypothetical protein [Ignavibacteriaceae bacterium]
MQSLKKLFIAKIVRLKLPNVLYIRAITLLSLRFVSIFEGILDKKKVFLPGW